MLKEYTIVYIISKTFTKYILKVAKYIPFVFPESVVFFSKDIDENNDDSIWKKEMRNLTR